MDLKKFTLLSFVGIASMANAAIPYGYKVTPADGAAVETLSEISVYLELDEDIYSYPNPNITVNGEPVSVTGVTTGVWNDLLTWTLKNPITAPGEYEIVVGEYSFYYGWDEDDNPVMSWTVTVEGGTTPDDPVEFEPYENAHATISPEQGVYTSLSEFTLTFSHVSMADINYTKSASLVNDETGEVVATGKASYGSILQQAVVDLDKVVDAPGTYTLLIPEGMFYDGGSYDEEDLPELKFRYVISDNGSGVTPVEYAVEASPADGSTINVLDKVVLTYPDFEAVYQHDSEGICVVDAEGAEVATGSYSYGDKEANQILLTFTPAVTEEGDYSVIVPKRAFILGDMRDAVYSSEIVLNYHVSGSTAIENIEATAFKACPVYNVYGVKVADSLVNLPAGLYICNGRKIVVR